MENPEIIQKTFMASEARLEILRRLVLEYSGVVLEEQPTDRADDFMKRVRLTFTSAEQGEQFIGKMLELGKR